MLARWNEPQRHYHDQEHLVECLRWADETQAQHDQPGIILAALFYHDAIYQASRKDNEARSAALAGRVLRRAGVDAGVVLAVTAAIEATAEHAATDDSAQQWINDIDLAILGSPPERFARYQADIRREYWFVPAFIYAKKRRAVLQKFLNRMPIYQTPFFRERKEDRARHNLQGAVGGNPDTP